jgi:predicted RNase H-like HicB family nuclease
MSDRARYSMLIEWSNLDGVYVVSFPEWERAGHFANTHGATYVEAAQQGQEMLDALIQGAQADAQPLPPLAIFDDHAYAPGETAESIARENEALARDLETRTDARS